MNYNFSNLFLYVEFTRPVYGTEITAIGDLPH
jgi:hypothetical protein